MLKPITKELQHIPAYMLDTKEAVNEEQRRVRFVISSDKIDRDYEKIEVSAIASSIPGFAKNPTALACHVHRLDNGRSPVIGSWDTESFKAHAHHSEMDLTFADTELGLEYFKLYKDKHMRAVSVGFRPLEWHEENDTKHGKFWVITKLELLEISPVAVGSNREALSKIKVYQQQQEQCVETKEILDEAIKEIQPLIAEQLKTVVEEFTLGIEEHLDEIKSLLIPDRDELAKGLLGDLSDQLAPAGEKIITEQNLLEAVEEVLTKLIKNKE